MPVVQCDPGFYHLGDQCARKLIEPAKFQCPPGFAENNNRCVETERAQPQLVCPPGTSLRDGLCHARKAVSALNQCIKGTLDTSTGMCTLQVDAPSFEQCPPGATELGDVCVKDELTDPELSCPPGSEPSVIHGCFGGKGPHPPHKSCPPGFSLRDKGSCHRRLTLPRDLLCPPGFMLKGLRCMAMEYVAPQPVCPEGSIPLNKDCWQIESFLPENACPDNLMLDTRNNYCYGEVQSEKNPICERGTYDEAEKGCVLAEVAPSVLTCPPGSSMTNGLCQENVIRPPRIACPHDFTLKQGGKVPVCLGRALAEGELGCPPPYEDVGEICVFVETVPKMIGCAEGYLKGTSCIKPQSQTPLILCPDGYIYDQSSQVCRKLLWARPVPICPKGFIYDNLVQKCYRMKKKGEQPSRPQPTHENVLPLEVQPETTTTTKKVKAKIRPQIGKEQFIPMATFTGPDAVRQAGTFEALKLVNAAHGEPPHNVFTPPVSV
eukprot:Gregarina_sp_Poly_1__8723@NODE_520_length_7746_cov_143_641620_g413_i0_p2_GENE_NODE_520_length_7746_cov_143_641620_g413_i0NODE_520_length_7746_cov_143_641620_g413_i0_p2_ORF_typecomplete_len491_score40_02CBM_14/PF01607_24/17CBM_14/PF01607_24/1_3e04CBM_14/PF01607_24/1_5e04CBM_14/PF01607_24/4_2e03CBM_14/PF01607_24/1_1e03CBM_14/PF01607_24/7_4e03CBM_14/PF01607_24/6_3e02CBM_14/PF01607_24/3_3e03CBM_14/PF01607_24/0_027CBM_14/PF01607_24/32TIL/PF01826_17/0_24TIL/PF01826_17/1_4e02TIL/PF01826_17/1_2e02TIL/PF